MGNKGVLEQVKNKPEYTQLTIEELREMFSDLLYSKHIKRTEKEENIAKKRHLLSLNKNKKKNI